MNSTVSTHRICSRFRLWLFRGAPQPASAWQVVVWWELRRIPFNLIIGVYAFACLIIFDVASAATGVLKPGDDAVGPMAFIIAPFMVNVLYTLGWLVEIPARSISRISVPCS